jgi:hypothetical protein
MPVVEHKRDARIQATQEGSHYDETLTLFTCEGQRRLKGWIFTVN